MSIQGISDNYVSSHEEGTDAENFALAARVITNDNLLCVPYYTKNISQSQLMLEQFTSSAATEIFFLKKRLSSAKDVTTENDWIFEQGVRSVLDAAIYVINCFMQKDRFSQQKWKNDTFHRSTVIHADCVIDSEKNSDAGVNCKTAIVKYSKPFGEIVPCFLLLAKTNFLQPYFPLKDNYNF